VPRVSLGAWCIRFEGVPVEHCVRAGVWPSSTRVGHATAPARRWSDRVDGGQPHELAEPTTDYEVLPLEDDDVLDDVSESVWLAVSLVGSPVGGEVLAVLLDNNCRLAPTAARIPSPGFEPLGDCVEPAVVDGDVLLPSVRSVTFSETASVALSGLWPA
jgi:hypothetical protein